ncbi:unnamed protein product [Mytilus coruscus]|uniref:Ig-like domain-containing protein n=1 Tax=Mytilus coruscus TaxID=42192 RepID=A0A6J8E3P6_MYTCO|nr:unnamed protein product [Mytilus coruscus]
MEMYVVLAVLVIYFGGALSKDINVRIEPENVFLDTDDLVITCEYNSQSVKTPTWITITRNGWYGKHDIVTMTAGNPPSIGYFFSGSEFTSRMEVTGSIKEKTVRVAMTTVECLDEAHYECTAGGFTDQGRLEKFTDSYSLVVNSHSNRPYVKMNGLIVPAKTPIGITNGDEVKIECDAFVGKPPKPMYWYRYDNNNGSYVIERNMITKIERRLLERDLCRWYTKFSIRFIASLSTPEVRLRCAVGNEQEDVFINVIPAIGP